MIYQKSKYQRLRFRNANFTQILLHFITFEKHAIDACNKNCINFYMKCFCIKNKLTGEMPEIFEKIIFNLIRKKFK